MKRTADPDGPLVRLDAPLFGEVDVLNLAGDYSYLSSGYYASLDAELRGERVAPTPAEALDAYVVPIAVAKARAHDLAVPESELVTDRFPSPPFMAYPVNPFSSRGELIPDDAALAARRNGLTYTGKYAALVQRLPADARVDVVRCVLGRTLIGPYAELAHDLFRVFRLPLFRARIVVASQVYLLSALEPLPFDTLSTAERGLLEGTPGWPD